MTAYYEILKGGDTFGVFVSDSPDAVISQVGDTIPLPPRFAERGFSVKRITALEASRMMMVYPTVSLEDFAAEAGR